MSHADTKYIHIYIYMIILYVPYIDLKQLKIAIHNAFQSQPCRQTDKHDYHQGYHH